MWQAGCDMEWKTVNGMCVTGFSMEKGRKEEAGGGIV